MKNPKTLIIAVALSIGALLSSCSTSYMLPKSTEVHANVYGAYIELRLKRGNPVRDIQGELIAVDAQKLYIISTQYDSLYHIELEKEKVLKFRLYHFEPEYPVVSNVALSLLPISHGIIGVGTLTTNIIGMGVVNGQIKDRASSTSSEMELDEIGPFARFPQGMPPSLSFRSLKPIPKYQFKKKS